MALKLREVAGRALGELGELGELRGVMAGAGERGDGQGTRGAGRVVVGQAVAVELAVAKLARGVMARPLGVRVMAGWLWGWGKEKGRLCFEPPRLFSV